MNTGMLVMALVTVLMAIVLSGCTWFQEDPPVRIDPSDMYTIQVMYFGDQAFLTRYGHSFLSKYPNVHLVVLPYPDMRLGQDSAAIVTDYIHRHEPDVLFIENYALYHSLASAGVMQALDPYIREDRLDTSGWYAGLVHALRSPADHQLYGLSPTFTTRGIYYNQTLFESASIPAPTDQMSWGELLELSKRLTVHDRSGLVLPSFSPYELVKEIGMGQPVLDAAGRIPRLNADGWRHIWHSAAEAFRQGHVRTAQERELFLGGKAGMLLDISSMVPSFERSLPFDWGVVSEPVAEDNRHAAHTIYPHQIFAIHAQAEKPTRDVAWELLKHIHSPEVAEEINEPQTLLLHQEVYLRGRKVDVSSFYRLSEWASLPMELESEELVAGLEPLAGELFGGVIEGRVRAEDALQQLHAEAEQWLSERQRGAGAGGN